MKARLNGTGYVFSAADKAGDWLGIDNDDWDIVVHASRGDERFMGRREIDGSPCNVFDCGGGRFVAVINYGND